MDCIRNRRTGRKAPGPCKARWDSLLVKFRNYTIRDGEEKGGGGKGGIWMPVKVIFINSVFIRVTSLLRVGFKRCSSLPLCLRMEVSLTFQFTGIQVLLEMILCLLYTFKYIHAIFMVYRPFSCANLIISNCFIFEK